jgi:hypothetical protein
MLSGEPNDPAIKPTANIDANASAKIEISQPGLVPSPTSVSEISMTTCTRFNSHLRMNLKTAVAKYPCLTEGIINTGVQSGHIKPIPKKVFGGFYYDYSIAELEKLVQHVSNNKKLGLTGPLVMDAATKSRMTQLRRRLNGCDKKIAKINEEKVMMQDELDRLVDLYKEVPQLKRSKNSK